MKGHDPFFLNAWKDFHKEPDYIIHMETMEDDLKVIPFFKDESKVNQAITLLLILITSKMSHPYDEYEGEFQRFKRFYTQEIADLVYSNMEPYFTKFGYE